MSLCKNTIQRSDKRLGSGVLCLDRGYSHVKTYGDVPPKWVTFFTKKSLDMGPILFKKSLQEGPMSQKLRKINVKSAIFEVE